MRRTYGPVVGLVLIMLAVAGGVYAQGAALEGTVTLKGGKTLTGEIKAAQVGVLQGCGVGTLLEGMGSFRVKVGEAVVEVKAADLAVAEVAWVLANEKDPQSWEIKQIQLIKRDGTTVVGKPTWTVQATSVVVGAQPAVYAFPKAGMDFSPDNLLTKIEIAGAMPAVIQPPPAETTPAPTTPTETAPAETAPAETAPAPTTTPTEAPPVETAPPATTPPVVVTATVPPAVGQGSMEIVVTCPKCGEKMIVRISVNVTSAP